MKEGTFVDFVEYLTEVPSFIVKSCYNRLRYGIEFSDAASQMAGSVQKKGLEDLRERTCN